MESAFLLLTMVTKFCWSNLALFTASLLYLHFKLAYKWNFSPMYIYVVWYPIVSSILSATMAIKKRGNNGKIGSISILNFEPLQNQFFFFLRRQFKP